MKNRYFFIFLNCIILFNSCSQIFVEDISENDVVLVSPSDNIITTETNQQFWWEEVEGATEYTLEIAKPSFDKIELLVLDTTISATKYLYSFSSPGKYEWRVRAKNSGYETQNNSRFLEIDSSLNLSNKSIIFLSPANNSFLNSETFKIRWSKVLYAESYILTVIEQSGEGLVYLDSYQVFTNEVSLPVIGSDYLLEETTYKISVYAVNSLPSQTSSAIRYVTMDFTLPSDPEIVSPKDNDTLVLTNGFGSFEWKHDESDSSIDHDSICIYSDLAGNTLVSSKTTTLQKIDIGNLSSSKTYYWRVYSVDKVGNVSKSNTLYSFRTKL